MAKQEQGKAESNKKETSKNSSIVNQNIQQPVTINHEKSYKSIFAAYISHHLNDVSDCVPIFPFFSDIFFHSVTTQHIKAAMVRSHGLQ